MERLAGDFHVLAPDGLGAGRSPAWPTDRQVTLSDEVDLLEPVFARAGDQPILVGHSYGAAVALVAAVRDPGRFQALVLYEPVLFALVEADTSPPNGADGLRRAVATATRLLDRGDRAGAAECFIDFWMGSGSWRAMPESRRAPIREAIVNLPDWTRALFTEPTPIEAWSTLEAPVLYMTGRDSPASSQSVERLLVPILPQVNVVAFDGVGHMGPITHPERVNEAVVRFLEQVTHAPVHV
jgi:pimeloyl-ACP methyl ester carboxylesterase